MNEHVSARVAARFVTRPATVAGCAALAAALVLGGCADRDASPRLGAPAPSSTPASAPSSPPSSSVAAPTRLSGTVVAGVEPSCLVLRDHGTDYELTGKAAAVLRPRQRVTVTGHVGSGVMSHCMQGTPFVVTSVIER
jgi:hypothetical protein